MISGNHVLGFSRQRTAKHLLGANGPHRPAGRQTVVHPLGAGELLGAGQRVVGGTWQPGSAAGHRAGSVRDREKHSETGEL